MTATGEVLGDARDTRWPRACIEHAAYRDLWRTLVEGCAKRFRDHPAVILWDVHNEPSHVCYCRLCQSLFKEYLIRHYGNLDQINAAWNTHFASLDQCAQRPQERPGVEARSKAILERGGCSKPKDSLLFSMKGWR